MARTKTSVCTASTMWPMWRLPLAYGRAMVTSMRELIAPHIAKPQPLSASGAAADTHFDQQSLHQELRIGAVLQIEVRFRTAHQRPAPERSRRAAGALVREPGRERVRHLLLLSRQLFLERRKHL